MKMLSFLIAVVFSMALTSPLALFGEGRAGEEQMAPVRLQLDLVDDSRFTGIPGISTVDVLTSFGKMVIPIAQIRTIEIDDDRETAKVKLQNGDHITGTITLEPIKLTTEFGKKRSRN